MITITYYRFSDVSTVGLKTSRDLMFKFEARQ